MTSPGDTDLSIYVQDAIHDWGNSPWIPGLADRMAPVVWNQLAVDIGMRPDSYASGRVMLRDALSPCCIVGWCGAALTHQSGDGKGIQVEVLPPAISQMVDDGDINFLAIERISPDTIFCLDEALTFLNNVPTIGPTVYALVKSLHILESSTDDIDVSCSNPLVPFSICVSLPNTWTDIAVVRVAESILHEAMHLQLTLVERIVPLVLSQKNRHYSPWRDDWRDAQGILHALYVFGVIHAFLTRIPQEELAEAVKSYLSDRLSMISSQIEQIRPFQTCEDLTVHGSRLVNHLFDSL